jgi:hypothetical protein
MLLEERALRILDAGDLFCGGRRDRKGHETRDEDQELVHA